MVELQIINKLLNSKSMELVVDNGIDINYFPEYEQEYKFISEHFNSYGNIPDKATFSSKFPDFEYLDVTEDDLYLVNTIREEYLYAKSVPIIKRAAELLKEDANAASSYLQSQLVELTPNYTVPYVDITKSTSRLEVFKDKSVHKDKWFIPTGFQELDDIVGGWQQGEEYVVLFARTGQGKSWVLVKSMEYAWQIGKNVGYISPEMSADRIGYRFDTMHKHLSNVSLVRGNTSDISVDSYTNYMDDLNKASNKFLVSTPRDFNNKVTVSKLRNFVVQNGLDILAIDGITYLSDERYKRGDNKTTTLTNVSEDLMQLSCELKIPILVVVQSNRGGVKDDGNATPELEDIRDSDGISHNATKVISLKQKDKGLLMELKKNRDGAVGGKLTYLWDIDKGEFTWIPSDDDSASNEIKAERKAEIRNEFKEKRKVVF